MRRRQWPWVASLEKKFPGANPIFGLDTVFVVRACVRVLCVRVLGAFDNLEHVRVRVCVRGVGVPG